MFAAKSTWIYFSLLCGLLFALIAFGEPHSLRLILNSFLLAIATSLLALPVGYLLAIALNRLDLPLKKWGRFSLHVLLFIPIYLQVACWRALLGPAGLIQAQLGDFVRPVLLDAWWGTIALHALVMIPWVFLFTEISLSQIPVELEERALLDAGKWSVISKVTMRQASPGLITSLFWIVLFSYSEMTITSICNVRTYPEVLFTGITLGESNTEAGLDWTTGILLLLIIALLASRMAIALVPQQVESSTKSNHSFNLGSSKIVTKISIWSLVILLVGVPVIGLVYKAGVYATRENTTWVRGWSVGKVTEIISTSLIEYQDEFIWSLVLGLACAILCTTLALPLAWVACQHKKFAILLTIVCGLLVAIPKPLIGLGLIQLFTFSNYPFVIFLYDQTILPPLLAVMVVSFPITFFLSWYVFFASASDLKEAASSEGATFWQSFYYLGILQHKRLIFACLLVSFCLAVADVGASFLVIPPGIDTIARRIFGLLHYGTEDNVAGICLIMLFVSGILASVTNYLLISKSSKEH